MDTRQPTQSLVRLRTSCVFSYFSESEIRYDCEKNEWNHCDRFDFIENAGAHPIDDDDDDSDGDEYVWGSAPPQTGYGSDDEPTRGSATPSFKQHPGDEQRRPLFPQPGPSGSDEPIWGAAALSFERNPGDEQWGPASPRPEQSDGHKSVSGPATPWYGFCDGRWGSASCRLGPEQNDDDPLFHGDGVPRDGEDVEMEDGFPRGDQAAPEVDSQAEATDPSVGEGVIGGPAEATPFDSQAHLSQPLASQHTARPGLAALWEDSRDFLNSRYGFTGASSDTDVTEHQGWWMALGIKDVTPSKDLVRLQDSVRQGAWPTTVCDLSPDSLSASPFPDVPPGMAVEFSPTLKAHVIAATPVTDNGWKLLIKDPLTVVQIRRLGWGSDRCGLITALVRNGVPFQVLHPQKLEGGRFHSNPGPVVHPVGKEPKHVDYLAYRQELAVFFRRHPHAYAAAVCAGGILWRVATDVLPLPDEADIARPFYSDGCRSVAVGGKTYWSPQLSNSEQEVIVGVYRWAVGGS